MTDKKQNLYDDLDKPENWNLNKIRSDIKKTIDLIKQQEENKKMKTKNKGN